MMNATLDFMVDAYFMLWTVDRCSRQGNISMDELKNDEDVILALSQLKTILAQAESGTENIKQILDQRKYRGTITLQQYQSAKQLVWNIDEMSEKLKQII